METIFKYAILKAIPDPRRGERVNVGIAVFLKDRMDVRFSNLAKLQVIAGGEWAEYVKNVIQQLASIYEADREPDSVITKFSLLDRIIKFSEVAWFSITNAAQYEERVEGILTALVKKPRERAERPRSTRINTEIAHAFKKAKILAGPEEGIGHHKVVRDFYISREEELRADFILKNGVYHVTATLDLRRANVDIGQAALKAVVLDKAKKVFKRGTKRFGVYAAPKGTVQFKPHIELLSDYSDKAFNWESPSGRDAYKRAVYTALDISGPIL